MPSDGLVRETKSVSLVKSMLPVYLCGKFNSRLIHRLYEVPSKAQLLHGQFAAGAAHTMQTAVVNIPG